MSDPGSAAKDETAAQLEAEIARLRLLVRAAQEEERQLEEKLSRLRQKHRATSSS